MSNKFHFAIQLLFSISSFMWSHAQVCTGNLGDNIFEAGDFGTGTANILLPDPRIAPGYSYSNATPPPDGLYVITNNTGEWSRLYPSWLGIRDNSNDPNGYMMVVNASFSKGIFYEQIVTGLCENTLYEFSADIINLIRQNVSGHIKPDVHFLINDETKYITGEIPQSEKWNTYGFTFITGAGETSVKLTLRNNAPGGIGNDLALDNISFRPCGPEALILPVDIANICEDGKPIELIATVVGDQYPNPAFQWQRSPDEGMTWENIQGENDKSTPHTELAGGFYYYRYLLSGSSDNLDNSKCRVNSNIKIVRVVPKFYTIIDTLCDGLSYEVGSSKYGQTGIYKDSLISSLGCDSIVTLNLTILPDKGIEASVSTTPPSCYDDQDASIRVNQVNNGYPPYRIILNDLQTFDEAIFSGLEANDYNVRVEDRYGCQWEREVNIENPPIFVIDIGQDTTIELGAAIGLDFQTNYPLQNLEWLPKEAVVCNPNCLTQPLLPISTQTYKATAVSENGCEVADSIVVTVLEVRKVYFPNVFSPNYDDENDRFTVFGDSPNVQRVLSLKIFDRWGNQLYAQTDIPLNDERQGWDGTFKGAIVANGIYTFVTEILFLDEQVIQFSGDVLLISNE